MSNLAHSFASCQAPLFYICARCQRPILSHIRPGHDVCMVCWVEWLALCQWTANKFSWEDFMRRKPPPAPRPSCFRCTQYQELCKKCLYGRRPR